MNVQVTLVNMRAAALMRSMDTGVNVSLVLQVICYLILSFTDAQLNHAEVIFTSCR